MMTTVRVVFVLGLASSYAGVTLGSQGSGSARPAVTAEQRAAMMGEGAEIYGADCMECHRDGGMGPVLAGHTALADQDRVIRSILAGASGGDMPAFGPTLSDRQVAAVATYIRSAWNNAPGVVLEADVRRARAALTARK